MVILGLQIVDKLSKAQFFQETFLFANTSIEAVLKIFFFTLSNANIQFAEKKVI